MKKFNRDLNLLWYGRAGALLFLVVALFASCPNTYDFTSVNNRNLTALVPYPAKDGTVTKKINDTDQYTGKIEWRLKEGNPFTGSAFGYDTVYVAVLTLSAKSGHTFAGVGENSFTHDYGAVENPAGNGDDIDLSVTITFPATAAEGDMVVDELELNGLFGSPVKNAPLTTAETSAQYDVSLQWQNENGTGVSDPNFAPGTVYKAALELTAKSGYTLSGLDPDSFAYTGAAVVSGASVLDNGVFKIRLIVTFPRTAGENESTRVNAFNLTSLVAAPVRMTTPQTEITADQYAGSVAWKKTKDDSEHSGNFATLTVYKAVITLTASEGYTFEGVPENTFAYTGATAVANTVGGAAGITVEITFPRTEGNIAYLSGSEDLSIKASSWHKDNPATLLINGDTFDYWDYGWGGAGDNETSWDALKEGVTFNGDECGQGHHGVLPALDLPCASFFTLDLKEVKANIVSFEFYPRSEDGNGGEHMPIQWEVYISETVEIGIDPTVDNVRKVGEFEMDYPRPLGYVSVDLTQFNGGEALSGRYLQFRLLADKKNGKGSSWISVSGSEIRIGVDNG